LTGPWKFHVGAHDADVGLTGYVPGWTARGHAAYSGYAWYRITVSRTAVPGERLALLGPPDVDDAYQAFVDGHLVGSDGDFSTPTPVVYSIQPRMFAVPRPPGTVVVAFLRIAYEVIISRGMRSSPMSKCSRERWVCAP
jgi:hypothetical protein